MSTILKTATLSVLSFSISGVAQDQKSESTPTSRQTEESFLPKDKSQGYRYLLYNPSSEAKEEARVASPDLSSRSGRTGKQPELGQKTRSAEDR